MITMSWNILVVTLFSENVISFVALIDNGHMYLIHVDVLPSRHVHQQSVHSGATTSNQLTDTPLDRTFTDAEREGLRASA